MACPFYRRDVFRRVIEIRRDPTVEGSSIEDVFREIPADFLWRRARN